MEEAQKSTQKHLFICTNEREAGECCAQKNAMEILSILKKKAKEDPSWKGKVSVTKCGCLGFCSKGVAAVIYPEKKWLTNITSAEELIDTI